MAEISVPDLVTKFLDQGTDRPVLLEPGTLAGRYGRVALVCADLIALRALRPPAGVRTRVIGLYVVHAHAAVTVAPPPTWPPLKAIRSRARGGGWWTVLRFAGPADVAEVLREVGRQSVWPTFEASIDVLDRDAGAPLDERLLNPGGFVVAADGPVVDSATLDLRDGATAALVDGLRPAAGLRVSVWDDATARAVAGLAMAGVPVVSDSAPADRLGHVVAAAVSAPVDLTDSRAREEHSLVLRRAALDTFSTYARRSVGHPSVSVVMATRREDMLDFALAQVGRQRGVASLELVLAPHGFDVPVSRVQELVGPDVAVQVRPQPDAVIFGDVLQGAAEATSGDLVLKMDDDDWYAPDVVADLLRARAYSGAELVGMPAELHYIAPKGLTVQRGHPSEVYARFVAGGTMMVDRAVLREAGGFRAVRKYVDSQLMDAVLALGGEIYRTHGLGYVLRRNASGHTWEVDMEELLDPSRVVTSWPGFQPSRLLELDPAHLPRVGA